jgi:hypothetical protein
MSLSDLASLGSFVSGVAVLVSLIFLYFQLRQLTSQVKQAEKNQQAAIMQGRAAQAVNINMSGMDASVSEALNGGYRGEENIPDSALRQFHHYWRASFLTWEDTFYQHSGGLYPESAFDRFKTHIGSLLGNIGFRTQWRLQRRSFGPEFVAWMDQQVAEAPIDAPLEIAAHWRNALVAERSGAPY